MQQANFCVVYRRTFARTLKHREKVQKNASRSKLYLVFSKCRQITDGMFCHFTIDIPSLFVFFDK